MTKFEVSIEITPKGGALEVSESSGGTELEKHVVRALRVAVRNTFRELATQGVGNCTIDYMEGEGEGAEVVRGMKNRLL